MFNQLDDDGWKFVVAYARRSNNKTKAKYNSYEGNALLFGLFHHSDVIFMVAHWFWILITNLKNSLWNYINSQESWLGGLSSVLV
jgi:hypothetical protein